MVACVHWDTEVSQFAPFARTVIYPSHLSTWDQATTTYNSSSLTDAYDIPARQRWCHDQLIQRNADIYIDLDKYGRRAIRKRAESRC